MDERAITRKDYWELPKNVRDGIDEVLWEHSEKCFVWRENEGNGRYRYCIAAPGAEVNPDYSEGFKYYGVVTLDMMPDILHESFVLESFPDFYPPQGT